MPKLLDEYITEVATAHGKSLARELTQRSFPELEKLSGLRSQLSDSLYYEWAMLRAGWHLLGLVDQVDQTITLEQYWKYLVHFSTAFWRQQPGEYESAQLLAKECSKRIDLVNELRELNMLIGRGLAQNVLLCFILVHVCGLKFERFEDIVTSLDSSGDLNKAENEEVNLAEVLQMESLKEIRERASAAGKPDAIDMDPFALYYFSELMNAHALVAVRFLREPPAEALASSGRTPGSTGCLVSLALLAGTGLLAVLLVVSLSL